MSALWFLAGYFAGALIALATVVLGYYVADRRDQRKDGTP